MNNSVMRVLARLERQSRLEKTRRIDVPPEKRMLAITKETGQLLHMILSVTKARHVLEIGTSTGYSALWCADVVQKNSGMVLTMEKNIGKIKRAKKNFADAGVTRHVDILEGPAMMTLERLSGDEKFQNFFDLAFIDADKESVDRYFDLTLPLVRQGGIVMTDNMLYPEKYRTRMARFAKRIGRDPRVRTMTCPVGNGEEISFKV